MRSNMETFFLLTSRLQNAKVAKAIIWFLFMILTVHTFTAGCCKWTELFYSKHSKGFLQQANTSYSMLSILTVF